ncbi:MAG: deoxyribose-phosphate aldolase [Alcanivoracaceae bacterium]|nr:deoxyribose-phosphate aldolase [Alcanivoracaceae bacterium]
MKVKNKHVKRNPGTAFNLKWVNEIQINKSAIERRAASYAGRRSIKKQHQAAWLLKSLSCIDLTTLAGDDTVRRVKRLCEKAKNPVRKDMLKALGVDKLTVTTGAVCVYHEMLAAASEFLKGSGVQLAAVSTGFPAGLTPFDLRVEEIKRSVVAGATEIDIVISRRHVFAQDWQALYDETVAYRKACGDAHLKTILATGELGTLRNVAKASMVCMMAGADFIKTSTGKEKVNATLPVSLVMVRMIREYYEKTGYKIGYKPAGGISTAKESLLYLILMKEELGRDWLEPELFRFGASSLLGDIERQLEHHITGKYSASFRHAIG